MMRRLSDVTFLATLLILIWIIATRVPIIFDSTTCWTSCG